MWSWLADNALQLLTIALAVFGARKLRGALSWLSAVKERETLMAMLENETSWRTYWQAEAEQCHQEADRLRTALLSTGDAIRNG